MKEFINQLETLLKTAREAEAIQAKADLVKDLEIERLKRGNETLQEVIKMKDDLIIPELKATVTFFSPSKKGEEKKG